MQTEIVRLTAQLCSITDYDYRFENNDEIIDVFKWQIHSFAREFQSNLPKWIKLDTDIVEDLCSGKLNHLLHLELANDLVKLLLDEFGASIETEAINWAKQILEICQRIRSLINTTLNRDPALSLPSQLDSPLLRHKLSIDFNTVLCQPVAEMIATTEDLLKSENLNVEQRKDLTTALENSRIMYAVFQLSSILLNRQMFYFLPYFYHNYHSPFGTLSGWFQVLIKIENENLVAQQLHVLHELNRIAISNFERFRELMDAVSFILGYKSPRFVPHAVKISEYLTYMQIAVQKYQQNNPQILTQVNTSQIMLDLSIYTTLGLAAIYPLLDNAFKYTPDGSITVEANIHDKFFCLSIADTGIGIPEAEFEYIFEPFTQVGMQKKGLGLGLYLAKQHIEKAGGSISVESELGRGSKFTVKIPLIETSSATSP